MELLHFEQAMEEADEKGQAVSVFADWLESHDIGPWQTIRQLLQQPSLQWISFLRDSLSEESWREIGLMITEEATRVTNASSRPQHRSDADDNAGEANAIRRLLIDVDEHSATCTNVATVARLFEQLTIIDGRRPIDESLIRWLCELLAWRLASEWIQKQTTAPNA